MVLVVWLVSERFEMVERWRKNGFHVFFGGGSEGD